MINNAMPSGAGKDATGSKLSTMLALFVRGRTLNRFEAEDYHDHCLHTTVSTLKNTHGLAFNAEWETVPCLGGRSWVRVKRYSLLTAPTNLRGAKALLALWDAMAERKAAKRAAKTDQARKDGGQE